MKFHTTLKLDPHPFLRGGSFAICCVAVMHIFQAFMLSFWPMGGNATSLRAFIYVCWEYGINVKYVIPLLTLSSFFALVGALFQLGWIRLLVFLPQNSILGIMAIGGLYASWKGSYLDGTIIHWSHILVDQVPVTALWLIHASAILRRARDPNG